MFAYVYVTCFITCYSDGNGFLNLTFICPRIVNVLSEYNQQDATILNLFIHARHSVFFKRVFRPSSGAQNGTYSVTYLSDRYCYLLLEARSNKGLTNA